ncbi:uncharacterized protein P174DRAFT_440586 [Aspergillus novofumigatus IBT 16806]|uniref:Uncharacterized protein n=1 Tax=Aspergillus novofumigatus (strain IBT 16806) TaxID=1392255 RepID=A0A2I1CEE6_ASPN1|nr:uncharacterized protein P174DRAFT_440586 [Aspergillus novofumigatus IBT 16806]PKX95995.1 hypothetical protein P174DRAFT_440586 [Aspergillus novofumigatus IBT 16806]
MSLFDGGAIVLLQFGSILCAICLSGRWISVNRSPIIANLWESLVSGMFRDERRSDFWQSRCLTIYL